MMQTIVCGKCGGTRQSPDGRANACRVCVHPFEVNGLGKAPFRCVGLHEQRFKNPDGTTRPGTSCDYCGTSIVQVFTIQGADGSTFKVGCDCVVKTNDQPLLKQVKNLQRKQAKVKRDSFIEEKVQKQITKQQLLEAKREDARCSRVLLSLDIYARELEQLDAIATGKTWGAPIAKDMASRLRSDGWPLSDKQRSLIERMWAQHSSIPLASNYVGTVGKREEFSLILKSTRIVSERSFGWAQSSLWLWTFEDQTGNKLVWFTSKAPSVECFEDSANGWKGEKKCKVLATVEKHDLYKEEKQTVLSRCKVTFT